MQTYLASKLFLLHVDIEPKSFLKKACFVFCLLGALETSCKHKLMWQKSSLRRNISTFLELLHQPTWHIYPIITPFLALVCFQLTPEGNISLVAKCSTMFTSYSTGHWELPPQVPFIPFRYTRSCYRRVMDQPAILGEWWKWTKIVKLWVIKSKKGAKMHWSTEGESIISSVGHYMCSCSCSYTVHVVIWSIINLEHVERYWF